MNKYEAITKTRVMLDNNDLSTWIVRWSTRMNRAFGQCNYRKKEIVLSAFMFQNNSDEECMDTIIHEVAHALCPGDNHNYKWKRTARHLGGTGDLYYSSAKVISAPRRKMVKRWKAICPHCGQVFLKTRKPKLNRICSCPAKKTHTLKFINLDTNETIMGIQM